MKRQQQKQHTRGKLLKTAFEKFSLDGIMITKTIDIAQAAQVSHGSVFAHFPSREALLLAVIDEFGLQLGSQFQNQIKKGTIEEVLTTHLNVIRQWEPFYTQLVICAPHLPQEIRTSIVNIQSGIAYYLEKGLSGLTLDCPLYLILNTWLGLVHYYLANRNLFAPNGSVIETKGQELIQFFNNLIKGSINMKKCEACTSCGMPFQDPSDHVYCTHCTREDGTLKSYEEVLEATQGYFMHSQGIDENAAREMADSLLKKQPAWGG